ncbi:zinc finger BED domain-containing protein DAYSLEEPER [Tanacetum coccineum]
MASQSASDSATTGVGSTSALGIREIIQTTRNNEIWKDFNMCIMTNGQKKAQCKHCFNFLSVGSNTTLKHHISHPHCEVLKAQQNQNPEAGQTSMGRDGQIFMFNPDYLREQFAGLVIQRGLPFNHFDHEQTTRVFQNTMQPRYTHVSRSTLKRDAMKLWVAAKQATIDGFANLNNKVNLTTDIWSAPHNLPGSYMCVTAHWIEPSTWQMMKRVISFEEFSSAHSGTNLKYMLEKVFVMYGLKEKIMSITLDNASNNTSAMDKLKLKYDPPMGGRIRLVMWDHIQTWYLILSLFEVPWIDKETSQIALLEVENLLSAGLHQQLLSIVIRYEVVVDPCLLKKQDSDGGADGLAISLPCICSCHEVLVRSEAFDVGAYDLWVLMFGKKGLEMFESSNQVINGLASWPFFQTEFIYIPFGVVLEMAKELMLSMCFPHFLSCLTCINRVIFITVSTVVCSGTAGESSVAGAARVVTIVEVYPNEHRIESIKMINFIDISCEDNFEEVLKIKKIAHDLSGSTPSTRDSSPRLTPVETSDSLLEEFADELALLDPFPPGIGDANFDAEGDIRLLEKLLNDDPSSPLPPKELNFEEHKMIKSSIDDFPPLDVLGGNFVTLSNPLFDSNEEFTSSDDESPPKVDVPEENFKIYSNPLFEFVEEYISRNPVLSVTPLSDANKDECFDPGGDIDEIDAFLVIDVSMDIEDGYHNSEGDIIYLENLLNNDTIPYLPLEVFLDHDPRSLKDGLDNNDLKSMVKVFDPGISTYNFYSLEPVAYESPMEIALDYEDSRARGFVHRSLELPSFACLNMGIRYPRSY